MFPLDPAYISYLAPRSPAGPRSRAVSAGGGGGGGATGCSCCSCSACSRSSCRVRVIRGSGEGQASEYSAGGSMASQYGEHRAGQVEMSTQAHR